MYLTNVDPYLEAVHKTVRKSNIMMGTKEVVNFELDYKEKYLTSNKKILNYHNPNFANIPDSVNYVRKHFYDCSGGGPEETKKFLDSVSYNNELTNNLIIIKDVIYNPETEKFGYLFFDDFILYEGDAIKKNNSLYVFTFSPNTYKFVFFDVYGKEEISIQDFVEKFGLLYPVYNIEILNNHLIMLNNRLGLMFNYKGKNYRILDGEYFPGYLNNTVIFLKFTKDGFYANMLYKDPREKSRVLPLSESTINMLLGEFNYNNYTQYELTSRNQEVY